jgi:uncharacterized coiled-coil protein SlyX
MLILKKGKFMKFSILITLLILASCGKRHIRRTEYKENPFNNAKNEKRLDDLETRVASIEKDIKSSITNMAELSNSINSLETDLQNLNDELDQSNAEDGQDIQDLIDATTANYNNLIAIVNSLQDQVDDNISDLVALQENNSVVEYLDPCGDKPNAYDEIILKTSQGDFVAYFEQGNKRFLTKLEKNVQYQTTDSQACLFKIDNDGNLI